MKTRIEHDTMGEVEVPDDAYGGHRPNVVYKTSRLVRNGYLVP